MKLLQNIIALSLWLLFISDALADGRDLINLKTTEAGIHQVSYDSLFNYGLDLQGEPISNIALINQGAPQQIQVTGSSSDPSLFGPGSVIRFLAKQIDTLYTHTNVYTLRSDVDQARRIGIDVRGMPQGAFANSYLATKRFSPQNRYSFTSPDSNDPWYAKRIVAIGKSNQERVALQLDNVAEGGNRGATKPKLNVKLWGSTDLPGPGNDHSYKVYFNNREVASNQFDGLRAETVDTELEQVRHGRNVVTVALPMDTGKPYDVVNLNSVEVKYPRKFVAIDNRLDFTSSFNRFRISGFNNLSKDGSDLLVLREDAQGLNFVQTRSVFCRVGCLVTMAGSGRPAHYYVSAKTAAYSPELDALPIEQNITSGNAVYLIISHPDFIGRDGDNLLESFAYAQASEMGSSKVVDVEAIYARFGHHLFDPNAIRDYIRYAVNNMGTKYVLLVGGDVYDYRNFLKQGARSFIPSLYASTGNNVSFAPVDAKYADITGNDVPDISIGRLPVRTTSQLRSLFKKRQSYLDRNYTGTALLVADRFDVSQQYNFTTDADMIESKYLQEFDVEKAYIDDIGASAARRIVTRQINKGVSLMAFFGHSSTNQWSFEGLLTGNDASRFDNAGRPTVVMQWGCWNTYYVSPEEDSMGHRFMMDGEQGAVAVMGASTLTSANSERELADLVFAELVKGRRIGDAVTLAKQIYAKQNPKDLDVLLGWMVLGFPELLVN